MLVHCIVFILSCSLLQFHDKQQLDEHFDNLMQHFDFEKCFILKLK